MKKSLRGFDPEVRIVGEKLDMGVEWVGQLWDYAVLSADNDPYIPCRNCQEASDRSCACDK